MSGNIRYGVLFAAALYFSMLVLRASICPLAFFERAFSIAMNTRTAPVRNVFVFAYIEHAIQHFNDFMLGHKTLQ